MNWISVKDKLPNDYVFCFVACEDGIRACAHIRETTTAQGEPIRIWCYDSDGEPVDNVTHYLEIPLAPEK